MITPEQLKTWETEVSYLQSEIRRLREALEWYGNGENWELRHDAFNVSGLSDRYTMTTVFVGDGGNRAREALGMEGE